MAQQYKLKDLPKIELEELGKIEAEVEGIEGGKVLLVKVKGQVHALNANCTHYGAPLKNGVLTSDGRITCPWHGACFNAYTGDVEDAPAPNALNKFDIVEKDDGVYVTGKEADIKGAKRVINAKVVPQNQRKVVIVGSGSGAFGALQKLRELGYQDKVTVLTNEGLPIDRTKLSKALITDASKIYLQPQTWYDDGAIDILPETVTSVDFKGKAVKTKSGKTFPYTKLVLASGGTPKKLPLPGFKDLENIFVIRHVADIQAIVNAVANKGKSIVIIGTSFIGMEAANALAKDNSVTLVGLEDAPLERVMGKQVGQIFQRSLEKNGARFYLGASVDSAVPVSAGSRSVGAVKLKDGTELKADLVILGVGVSPATEYLRDNADVKLEKDGSLSVDESFAVKGLSDVYAIGDIATYPYSGPGGNKTPIRIEHWNVAQNAGRSVGRQIAQAGGSSKRPEPFIPVFWSALGTQLRYAGATPNGYDDLIIRGDPDHDKFVAYYTKGEEVVAVASMNFDPIVVQSAELLRKGKMLTKSEIEAGKDPLKSTKL